MGALQFPGVQLHSLEQPRVGMVLSDLSHPGEAAVL